MRGITIEAKVRGIERATGCVIQTLYDRLGKPLSFKAWDGELIAQFAEEYIGTRENDAERALALLHTTIYRANGKEAYQSQEGKCAFCGKHMPPNSYEIDHKKSRGAHGRDDRVENLQAVCTGLSGCDTHRRKHGG